MLQVVNGMALHQVLIEFSLYGKGMNPSKLLKLLFTIILNEF